MTWDAQTDKTRLFATANLFQVDKKPAASGSDIGLLTLRLYK